MHVDAPVCARVFVTEPAEHSSHASVDTALKRPAAHCVHELAPVASSVSVTDPGSHTAHDVAEVEGLKRPCWQALQATIEALLKWPTAHGEHIVPPVSASVSVTDPAEQTEQATVDKALN